MTEIKELLAAIEAVKTLKEIAADHQNAIEAIRDELRFMQSELQRLGASIDFPGS